MQERLELGFDALTRALKRAEEADSDHAFAPLAESLMWLVMINDAFWEENQEMYVVHREVDEIGRTFEGLRYARHRLVHDIRVYGMHGVFEGGVWGRSNWGEAVYGDTPSWNWRRTDDLGPAIDRGGEDVYREYLEGQPVFPTLEAGAAYLGGYRDEWTPSNSEVSM